MEINNTVHAGGVIVRNATGKCMTEGYNGRASNVADRTETWRTMKGNETRDK